MDSDADGEDVGDLFREIGEILSPPGDEGTPTLGSPVSEPSMWTPLEGWGTIRDYIVVRNETGGTDVGCYFIPDDGSKPISLVWHDVAEGSVPLKGLGEFARGVSTGSGDNLDVLIKITPEGMVKAEKLIAEINALETVKRVLMQKRQESFWQTCGYGPDKSWRLIKYAPGLLRE
jgi:hypothetical protein